MKKVLGGLVCSLLVLMGSMASGETASPQTGSLEVTIHGLVVQQGVLRVALFVGATGFPDNPSQAFRHYIGPVKADTLTLTFDDIVFGPYAVSVHHDINENGRLDKSFFGIPQEPIAVSNNPKKFFGPPSFDQARFQFRESNQKIVIELITKNPLDRN
ncbi:MAG: DUF2141 domain-containing protein [Desulfobacteraceae bacterium]